MYSAALRPLYNLTGVKFTGHEIYWELESHTSRLSPQCRRPHVQLQLSHGLTFMSRSW